jgi:uncharacterized membrane protein
MVQYQTYAYTGYFFFFSCLTGVDIISSCSICRELIVNFPARKIITLMAGTSLVVMIATDGSEVKVAKKKQERVKG